MGIGPGTILEWEDVGGKIVVRKVGRFSSEDVHRAIFTKRPKARSLRELKAGIRQHSRKKHARG